MNWAIKIVVGDKGSHHHQRKEAEILCLLFPEEPVEIRNWPIKVVVGDKDRITINERKQKFCVCYFRRNPFESGIGQSKS